MNHDKSTHDTAIRAGIFSESEGARTAVDNLREYGFSTSEVSVICRDPELTEQFPEFVPESSTPNDDASSIGKAGKVGFGVAGTVAALELISTGGLSIFVIGALAGVAIVSTFVGLMAMRGMETEVAEFYEQAVQAGNILVAVEYQGEDHAEKLDDAERILAEAGSKPVSLSEE